MRMILSRDITLQGKFVGKLTVSLAEELPLLLPAVEVKYYNYISRNSTSCVINVIHHSFPQRTQRLRVFSITSLVQCHDIYRLSLYLCFYVRAVTHFGCFSSCWCYSGQCDLD